jgi:hypothetical protein
MLENVRMDECAATVGRDALRTRARRRLMVAGLVAATLSFVPVTARNAVTALGKELATSGILVNAVTPAVFRTPLLAQMPQSQVDYTVAKIPMGRVGEVDEVAVLVCWLLSDDCSFSTAATFDISGGRSTY